MVANEGDGFRQVVLGFVLIFVMNGLASRAYQSLDRPAELAYQNLLCGSEKDSHFVHCMYHMRLHRITGDFDNSQFYDI